MLFYGRPVADLLALLPEEGIEARAFLPLEWNLREGEIALLLFDPSMAGALADPPPAGLGTGAERVAVLLLGERLPAADPFWQARVYFSLPEDAPAPHVTRAVKFLFRVLEERAVSALARRSLTARTEEIRSLVGVGVALAAEKEPEQLLETILSSARALTQAEGGSLYLIEEGPGGGQGEASASGEMLRFALAQNDAVRLDFEERALPLDDSSIAGFVARSGETVNLPDVSAPPAGAPYHFDAEFDKRCRYRTRSMLAVPMKTPQGRTIGVLQLVNRRRSALPDPAITAVIRFDVVPFDEENEEITRALAAQAAVAVENRRLTESIRQLFEGFVQASVTAIEQRDPTTSGHSERVARLSCALAELADGAETGPYAAFRIGKEELRELRYAAVLHDFGKVGVREQVLVKAKKLLPLGRELLRFRFDCAILSAAAEIWERAARGNWPEEEVAKALSARCGELENAWKVVLRADEPSLLPAEVSAEVAALKDLLFRDASGTLRPLVEPEEVAYLSIQHGSLSARERAEIQSHVTQTFRFLSKIPWTPDLSRVPEWAYAHHEKLDGSGYPRGLKAESIPVPVRVITICDIYDALAARDRPYKKAVRPERALDILREEARHGRVDADLLDLFIGGKVHEIVLSKLG